MFPEGDIELTIKDRMKGVEQLNYVPYENGIFREAAPDSQGVPSRAVLRFLKELEAQNVDIHSLYIFRNGRQLVGANRKPYGPDTPRRIYSAAKALTGLAVLFAVQEGRISLDTRLETIFPEDMPQAPVPYAKALNVYHLMTMTTGHGRDTFRAVLDGENSVRAFLEEPFEYEPGTHFLYNNGVPHILGMIVEKVSGQDYLSYLRERFLEPLGIFCTVERTAEGELEGSRTVCTAEDFAKLTLFWLQEGMWNGKQLLDKKLMQAAAARQVESGRCPSISFMHTDQMAGYGFQVWRNFREGYRLDGGRSQFGFVFPEKELAIVCNAIEEDSGLIPAILWDTLYPAIGEPPETDVDCGEGDAEKLEQYLAAWSCAPRLKARPVFMDDFYGSQYELGENPWGIKGLALCLENGMPRIYLWAGDREYAVDCGLNGEWAANREFPPMPAENERLNRIFGVKKAEYYVSGGWASDFCFVFQVRASDWMDYHTFYCRFNGQRMSLSVEANMERMSHIRKRIPIRPWNYSDAPVEGRRG